MLQLVTKIFPLSSCVTVFIQTAFPLLIFPVFSQKTACLFSYMSVEHKAFRVMA